MTTTAAILAPFSADRIVSVYSGKAGKCACGCAGKHSYSSEHVEKASELRGYPVTADEVNNTQVKRVLRIIAGAPTADDLEVGDTYVARVVGARQYIAYVG